MQNIIGGGTADRNEIISKIYDFYDVGVTVRVRFEPYYSEKVGMLAVTGFRAESRPGGEVRFSWDRHPFASRYALYSFYYRSADTLGSEWRQVVTFSGDSGLLVPVVLVFEYSEDGEVWKVCSVIELQFITAIS